MAETMSATVTEVTDSYLASLNLNNLPPPEVRESELLRLTCSVFEVENSQFPKEQKWSMPKSLYNIQIARLLAYCDNVVCIAAAGRHQDSEYDLIGVYATEGDDEGTYVTDTAMLREKISRHYV